MNLLERYNVNQIERLSEGKNFAKFSPGDTIRVYVVIKDADKSRLQSFEGVCIAKRNCGLNSTFTVRRSSPVSPVERKFFVYSPAVNKVEVVKSGIVRRAKLYYLRGLSGKKARIKSKRVFAV